MAVCHVLSRAFLGNLLNIHSVALITPCITCNFPRFNALQLVRFLSISIRRTVFELSRVNKKSTVLNTSFGWRYSSKCFDIISLISKGIGLRHEVHKWLWRQRPSQVKFLYVSVRINMMTLSNGNIFRVTGPLCGEFTGPGEFPTQRPVTRSFDVFLDLRLNKRLNKQSWGWWFETLSRPFWRHRNDIDKSGYTPWLYWVHMLVAYLVSIIYRKPQNIYPNPTKYRIIYFGSGKLSTQ